MYYTLTDSPLGPLTLLSDGKSLTGLYMVRADEHPDRINVEPSEQALTAVSQNNRARLDVSVAGLLHGALERSDLELFQRAIMQLREYFNKERTTFDVPVNLQGSEFQIMVWSELIKIPYGTTISYGELANRISNPNASRAVGLANGKNPISIIVPCHRVIGANGTLTGYGGGLVNKKLLLQLEGTAVKQLVLM